MAASTAERFDLGRLAVRNWVVPVAATTKIWKGSAVCTDASGNANPAADTSGLKFIGFARETVDNTGIAGAANISVDPITDPRIQQYSLFNCTSGAQTWVGAHVFFTDDNTVALSGSSTNKVIAGTVKEIIGTSGSATQVKVDCSERFALASS